MSFELSDTSLALDVLPPFRKRVKMLHVLISSLLSLCVLCVTTVVALTITPACLLVFGYNLSFGSCGLNKDKLSNETSLTTQNKNLEAEIFYLEKKLLTIDCTSTKVSALPEQVQPQDINIQEWKSGKISTLKNCWKLTGDQYEIEDVNTGSITTFHNWELCFDENGAGNQKLVSTSINCSGNITAKFNDDGSLQILDETDVNCSNQSIIFRREMKCTLNLAGRAKCGAYQPGQGRGGSSFELVRKLEGE